MMKLLILTSALLAISVAAPPNTDRLPESPTHAEHKNQPIVPVEDLSTLSKSSEEKRKDLEKELGINRQRRDHHEGHEKQPENPHHDHGVADKKVPVQAKPLPLKHDEPNKHENHKRDVVADDKHPVLGHEQQHNPHGIALKDPLAKPEEKKENPSACLCKKEKRDVHELPGANCQCQKEKRDIPRPEDGHKHEQKPNEHPHDDQKDHNKKDSSEESHDKNHNTKLHASQRQKRDIHELTKEHDDKSKKSSSSEESSNESKEENKSKSTTALPGLSHHNNHKRNVPKKSSSEESSSESKESNEKKDGTTTTALPALTLHHDNNKRDVPVPTVAKHEHPASSETHKAEANKKDDKAQVEDLASHIPPSAKPIHAHTATVAHTTHFPTTPGQHPLISNEPIPIKSIRPHDQA